ncbi:hypothetical protein NA57DRAFT_72964 [Rhizodiscina lignyota]|uniref:Uncharacterized protein n=1 Tax=Rhizodiscina lignyota TaxID=1504668 RepID=A0A9P4ILB8_9PEZI|nr:hypothetical protein NA57DRAFT_72964 [Rhizodiscina lignyota]
MSALAPPDYDDLPYTPNTRSEVEAAFASNTLTQTASAGQAPPYKFQDPSSPVTGRPSLQSRSSNNYIDATTTAATKSTASPPATLAPRPKGIPMPVSPSAEDLAAQNAAAEAAFLAEQAAAKRSSVDMKSDSIARVLSPESGNEVKAGSPRMLKVHGRQQSWNKEDMKRMMQEPLMKEDGGPIQGYSGKGGGVTGF